MGYRFDFYDEISEFDIQVKRGIKKINKIYKQIPETCGCMENINSCKAWCCKIQTPQFLYIEFLNIWKYVLEHFTVDEIIELISKSVKNYVKGDINKPCVFIDEDTGMCPIHDVRGFSCRIYGIMDTDEFNKNLKKVREQYKDNICAVFKEQCSLVSCKDGKIFSKNESDDLFNRLKKIEKSIGINENVINDGPNGSYRAPHDHILIKIFPPDIMSSLSNIRNLTEIDLTKLPDNLKNKYTDLESFKLEQITFFLNGVKDLLRKVFSKNEPNKEKS